MADIIIATAYTNSAQDSEVKISIGDIICHIEIEKNKFSDTLPVIPSSARVENGRILYHLKLKACLTRISDGGKVANCSLKIRSNRKVDNIIIREKTNGNGELNFVLETRHSGDIELDVDNPGVTSKTFKISLKDAWYEEPFLITGYNICDEKDFSGPKVSGNGLEGKYKEDFLFGAKGVPMQGTGKSADGRYIALLQLVGGWHRNSRGAPDRVASQASTSFHYVDSAEGKYGSVTENHSIAVDITVIPPRAEVDISGLGRRFADDTGSAIRTYHLDNFLGAGDDVVKAWMHGGVNGTRRQVKYIGKKK
ncbi:hypothetical protein GTP23_14225 [Pseudoduganella sp. FT93W]|uniref:3D domain-containing protein n=1 Tax=Duganella fentianensis TaxID=2692177 RepID=A0A845I312_9BURK|nr:3D domain-containing protein [Duganella fentianensis]MYN46205.1 hypothetical protein [Duganella fentianensis]